MLDEYRQIYVDRAGKIDNWKTSDRNELCRKYISCQDGWKKECYLSAIIVCFWSVLTKTYNKQAVKVLSEEDCYDCMINAILQALDQHAWDDPDSNIYQDKRGPERAINILFQHETINMYVASQRQKRKLSSNATSLDAMTCNDDGDEYREFHFLSNEKEDGRNFYNKVGWDQMVISYFNKKDYFSAFALDGLLNYDIVDKQQQDSVVQFYINYRKLHSFFNLIDDNYKKTFSDIYGLDEQKVEKAISYVEGMQVDKIDNNFKIFFKKLRLEKDLI